MKTILNGIMLILALIVIFWFGESILHAVGLTKQEKSLASVAGEVRAKTSDLFYDIKYSKFMHAVDQKIKAFTDAADRKNQKSADELKQVEPGAFSKIINRDDHDD